MDTWEIYVGRSKLDIMKQGLDQSRVMKTREGLNLELIEAVLEGGGREETRAPSHHQHDSPWICSCYK